jgi:hypothetical protein
MEFVPFGQDGIPPTAGKTTKCRMLYNSLEFVYKKGFEAFNLLTFLTSYLLNFFLFPLAPVKHPQKLLINNAYLPEFFSAFSCLKDTFLFLARRVRNLRISSQIQVRNELIVSIILCYKFCSLDLCSCCDKGISNKKPMTKSELAKEPYSFV